MAKQNQQELLDFIDQLIPAYETAKDPVAANKRRRASYHWSEFLHFYDEFFVRNAYVVIFQREPDASGMQSGLQALRLEKRSRIELLGRLRFSNEGNLHGVVIKGLWSRYQLARLQRLPVIGALVGALAKLDSLSRPDLKNEALQFKIDQQKDTIGLAEQKLSAHFDRVAANMGDRWNDSQPGTSGETTEADVGGVQPTLGQLLEITGAQFVLAAYHTVLGRAPHEQELKSALSKFLSGKESKILLLAKLCESKEAQLTRQDIAGLPASYVKERLFALPVIGFFLQLPRAVLMLNRANTILEFQQSEIAECEHQVNRFESRLAGHYNDTVKHLKLKFVELVQAPQD